MLEEKIKSLLKKYKIKCISIKIYDGRLVLQVRETRSTAFKLLDSITSLGLVPRSIVYGRWEFSIRSRYAEDITDE